ncbi:UNKNOWN [Stylonychia lemnae]|uniref:Uncharacterized protein n=1 Tax=Stylonychia lemnae TaxID=5949 RepID=A0A078B360_STYLE|nr:UNKNOWN [Stylonychia lemnae]|eukprot:CDW87923.1 UNKNOWN [Stylonychia lemnae]
MSKQEFDIGFLVDLINLPVEQNINIDQYVEVSIMQSKITITNADFNSELIELPSSRCQIGRFKGELAQTKTFDITNKFNCITNTKIAFQGSYYTEKAQLLQILVKKCNQKNLNAKNKNITCASKKEMDDILNHITLTILMTNQYIDVNEKSGNPIKTVLKNFYATVKSDLSLSYELRIGENYLIQSTNSLSNLLGQQNLTYYTIRDDSMQIGDNTKSDTLISFQILLDDVVTSTNLELFTLSDALSNTGGIIGIITIVVQVLVYNLQEYLYYQSMIKHTKMQGLNKTKKIKNYHPIRETKICKKQLNQETQLMTQKIEILFKQAKQKLDEKFEVIKVLKNHQMLKFIKQVSLAKYQRKLMPYFKQNLIRIKDKDSIDHIQNQTKIQDKLILQNRSNEEHLITWNDLTKNQKSITKLYLAQVIHNISQNAFDKRILKNLDQNVSNKQNSQIKNKIGEKAILFRLQEKYNDQNIDNGEDKKNSERYNIGIKEEVQFQTQIQENFTSNNQIDTTNMNLQEDDSNFFNEFIEKEFNI